MSFPANRTCTICGTRYYSLDASCLCDGCIKEYATLDFICESEKRCGNKSHHGLSSIFDAFFEKTEDIENALISYINDNFTEKQIKKILFEVAKEDEVWLCYRIEEKMKGDLK